MPPEPRSSDTARQGRDYRSAAPAKQVRFPVKRRAVRGQGNRVQKRESSSLKQQTLTQIGFISSFSEEIELTDDDDASDGAASDQNTSALVSQGASKALLTKKSRESTREASPVIQDSFGSPDGSVYDDASAEVSPSPRFQPREARRTAALPPLHSSANAGPLDAVKASPRRRAHLSRNLDGSIRLQQYSSAEDVVSSPAQIPSSAKELDDREIPDSDEESDELQLQDYRLMHQETYAMGNDTQLVLEELASLEYPGLDDEDPMADKLPISTPQSPVLTSSGGGAASTEPVLPTITSQTPTLLPSSSPLKTQPEPAFSQKEQDHNSTPTDVPFQGQAFESQRVPLHILQSFTPASARTDILLPISSDILNVIVDGSDTSLHLTYRVPDQVGRIWLFNHGLLRYMACVEPGKARDLGWDYHIDQVYELNNPIDEHDMQEEGWVNGEIRRYVYLPPAIVGQLLWNLRCATFDSHGSRRMDGDDTKRSSSHKHARSPTPSSGPVTQAESCINDHDSVQPSSLLFQDHGSSVATLPTIAAAFNSSPLLTKSQMLSDSLVSDDHL